MSKQYTLAHLLELSYELEQVAYDFYGALQNRFRHQPELVATLDSIKEDERLHLRMVQEMSDALADSDLSTFVHTDTVHLLERTLEYIRRVDVDSLDATNDIRDAIQTLEAAEIDVVLAYVDESTIGNDFVLENLTDESGSHAKRVQLLLQSFE